MGTHPFLAGVHMNINQYLESIGHRFGKDDSSEHTFRGDLEGLITTLTEGVELTNEPKNVSGSGSKPDYVVKRGEIPIGFIEAKDIGKDLNHKNYKEQFERYRKQFDNLIITDYIWFQFFQKGKLVHEIRIASIVNNQIKPIESNFPKFENLIINFCTFISQSIKSPKELAKMMAVKARLLQKDIEGALNLEVLNESLTKSKLMGEFDNFKRILVHDLDIKSFSDIYSQTLAYGMFTARLHDESLDTFSRQEAASLIPKSNPFLRSLFDNIAGIDIDDRIITTVDNLAEVFRATDVKDILKNFGRATQTQDPIIHFYETFLAEYDPALRKSRGVWYTPEPVVNFIVRGVDEILKTDFGFAKGLADNSKTIIKQEVQATDRKGKPLKRDKEVHKVQVLDPATGTGTFLAEVFRHIYNGEFKNKKGAWGGYVLKDLIPRLNGFEVLMASYAMAHLKLDMLMRDTGVEVSDEQRFHIYLTNSLEKYDDNTNNLFASPLSRESQDADLIKRDTPVMVVLGNPPYSGESANKGDWIMKLMEDYKKEPGGTEKLKERNPKWINDDYVKFMRYAQYFIEKNGEGILAFINPHGFLDNPTFRGMRWSLLKAFDKIYTIDLHGNSKKKEVSPDGSKDVNVFDIQQGVAITFFVKTGKKKTKDLAEVNHFDLYGERNKKYDFLWENSLKSIPFEKLPNVAPMYFMVSKDFEAEKKYSIGFSVQKLFIINAVGIVTARDAFSVHYTSDEVQKTIEAFLRLDDEMARSKFNLGKDVRDWKVSYAREDLVKSGLDFSNITPICYRPFEMRFTYYTGNSKGFHCYPRHEVMQHMFKRENVSLICPKQVPDKENAGAFISNSISGHKSCSAYNINSIFPLYLYPTVDTQQNLGESSERKPNLDSEIVKNIAKGLVLSFEAEKSGDKDKFAPIDLMDYIYAVLHSPSYRETYKEFLKIDFPRIPYPTDTDKFWALVALGGELRKIHLLESPLLDNHDISYPAGGNNKVTRKMTKNSVGYDPTSDTHGKVWINDQQYFDNVPLVAWEFYIGGYQPAQKWLKDRAKEEVDIVDDIDHYLRIIVALTETHRIMQEIDKLSYI